MYAQYPGVEFVSLYRKGGYHPVLIDDVFCNRYRVVNKLGYGTYGTVWLVEDLRLKRFAALKVMVADVSRHTSHEIDVLRHLGRQQYASAPGSGAEYVMQAFDYFEIEGPNGHHRCIVTELLGPGLGSLESVDVRLPLDIGRKIAAQVARGVAYLHRCGVAHGDLHLGNILLSTPEMERWSFEEVQRYFGKPAFAPVRRTDGKPIEKSEHLPQYLVSCPLPLPIFQLCVASPGSVRAKICDFGETFLYGAPDLDTKLASQLNILRLFAAPEIIFREPVPAGPPTDIWALAVLMHAILSRNCGLFDSYHGIEAEVVREMVLILGKLPHKWWTRWTERKDYFDDEATFVGDPDDLPRNSGKLLKINGVKDDELAAFEHLVRKMVCYEMKERILADEVVKLIPKDWNWN